MLPVWLVAGGMRILPYVLVAGAVFGGMYLIYNKGYNAAQNECQLAALALEMQRQADIIAAQKQVTDAIQTVAKADIEAITVTAKRKEEVRYAIKTVVKTVDVCDSADWLREYNDTVRAATQMGTNP